MTSFTAYFSSSMII